MTGALTDDMRKLLKAAFAIAPEGEEFTLEELDLPTLSAQARVDCAFVLGREPMQFLERLSNDRVDPKRNLPPNLSWYRLSKKGRPVARQLLADDGKAKRARRLAIAKWVWGFAVSIFMVVFGAWTKTKFDRLEKKQTETREKAATPPTSTTTQAAP